MNRLYLVSYQSRAHLVVEDFQTEVPTREEADDLADHLQEEGYENIIIEEIKI